MMQQPTLEMVVSLLQSMYTCHDNAQRRAFTLDVVNMENSLDEKHILEIGLGLLQVTTHGPATQAYGAVLLKHALHRGSIRTSQLPFWDLLMWYCNEPSLGRLLASDMAQLLIECVVMEKESDFVPQVLRILRPSESIDGEPKRVMLLNLLVTTLLEPDFDHVPRDRAGPLKRAITPHIGNLLSIVTNALFAYYVASGQANAVAFAPGTEQCVEACLGMMCVLASNAPYRVWVEVSLVDTIMALLTWVPAKKAVLIATTAVLRVGDRVEEEQGEALCAMLTNVLINVPSYVASTDLDVIDEVLELLEELPRSLVQATGSALYAALMPIFSIPSIHFATKACTFLQQLCETSAGSMNPVEVYNALKPFVSKSRFHPEMGTDPEGMRLSREQLSFVGLYDFTFSDFRCRCGKVMEALAVTFPTVTNQYILNLLLNLCDATGTPTDPRTRSGYVTQRSETFTSWEATQFAMDHLAEAFRFSSDYLTDCIDALLAKQPTDAVLLPVYFNMLSTFWRCKDDGALNVWEGTLLLLIKCIESIRTTGLDPDEVAARRRALTLLVRGCTEHVAQLGPLVPPTMKRMEPLFLQELGNDRFLLYEALTGLTNSLPLTEADAYLRPIINPIVNIFLQTLDGVDQARFNSIIICTSEDDRESRDNIRDCLNVLAAVLRRCNMTPYIVEKIVQVTPLLMQLLTLVQNINTADLPPGYAGLLSMDATEKEQFLPGKSRRSAIADTGDVSKNKVRQARGVLEQVRLAVYQLFGTLCSSVPREQFATLLQQILLAPNLPVHSTRRITESLLFLIGQKYKDLLPLVLGVLERFFMMRVEQKRHTAAASSSGGLPQSSREQDDIIEERQWVYFSKDVISYARARVLEPCLWKEDSQYLEAVYALAIAVFRSECDTRGVFRFLLQVFDLSADGCHPSVQEALPRVQVTVYSYVARYVMLADIATLGPKERDSAAYAISEPYIRLFPNLRPALQSAGIDDTQLDELQAHLFISNKLNIKRRKMKEFLLKFAPQS